MLMRCLYQQPFIPRQAPVMLMLMMVLSTHAILTCRASSAVSNGPLNIAGSVSVSPHAIQFVDVQVIDGTNGAILRSLPLDVTRSFSFSGLPATAEKVRLLLRLPERRFRLDTSASCLSAPIPKDTAADGNVTWLHLTAVVEIDTAVVGHQSQGSILTATLTALGLVLAAVGRNQLVPLLHLPAVKVPKPRRMVVMSSR